jgi:hypothetical protein
MGGYRAGISQAYSTSFAIFYKDHCVIMLLFYFGFWLMAENLASLDIDLLLRVVHITR